MAVPSHNKTAQLVDTIIGLVGILGVVAIVVLLFLGWL